jgi:hypothetical protein
MANDFKDIDAGDVQAIVNGAVDRYVAQRHARVDAFVDANYSLLGSLRLHRHAIGYDLVRAPVNVALMPPYLAARLTAAGAKQLKAKRVARWLESRRFFLSTDVARELAGRLHTELLELPYRDGDRHADRDALADEILKDARLAAALDVLAETLLRHRDDPRVGDRLNAMLETYGGARTAAAELVINLATAGTGAALFKQFTPGMLSLGPAVAGAIAHQAAVASFPLGAGLGGLWYGLIGVTPAAGLVVGATGGLIAVTAAATAFAGVIGDPVQRALGLHQRRLHKLIDATGDQLKGQSETAYQVRDHYAARIFDLMDLTRATYRLATGQLGA